MPRWQKCTKWMKLAEDTLFPLLFEIETGCKQPRPSPPPRPLDPSGESLPTRTTPASCPCPLSCLFGALQQPQRQSAECRAGSSPNESVGPVTCPAGATRSPSAPACASSSTSSPSPPWCRSGRSGGARPLRQFVSLSLSPATPPANGAAPATVRRSWA